MVHSRENLRNSRFDGSSLHAEVPRRQRLFQSRFNRGGLHDFLNVGLVYDVAEVKIGLPRTSLEFLPQR